MKNPQTTISLTFLTHIISDIDGVKFVKPMQVLLTSIGFTIVFRWLIFEFFLFKNADVVTIKDEISEINGGKIKEQDVSLT